MTDAHKEVHNHYSNGSGKVVWAWAGVATGIVVLLVVAMAKGQWDTNDRVAQAITNMSVRIGQLETKIDNLEQTIERQRGE